MGFPSRRRRPTHRYTCGCSSQCTCRSGYDDNVGDISFGTDGDLALGVGGGLTMEADGDIGIQAGPLSMELGEDNSPSDTFGGGDSDWDSGSGDF